MNAFGEYQLVEQIAEGGMCLIYKARRSGSNREVVLKFPKIEFIDDPEYKHKLQEEGEILASLNSQYTCALIEANFVEGFPYLALEYFPGKTLDSCPVYPEDKTLLLLEQLACCIAEIHSAGIIHCDINPANIMINSDFEIKILDFGIAQNLDSPNEEPQKVVIGSPVYISPEQIRGLSLDQRTDIYSLGAVFYKLVTGHCPFTGKLLDKLIRATIYEKPLSPRRLNRSLPLNIEKVILRMLEKEPKNRYQNIREVISELRYVSRGELSFFVTA